MRTLIVLIPARREGSETATKSGDNTRATTDNQHFTCRSQSPAPDSSAARPQETAKTNSQAAGPTTRRATTHPKNQHQNDRSTQPRSSTLDLQTLPSLTTTENQPPNHRASTPHVPLPFCKSAAHLRPPSGSPCKSVARRSSDFRASERCKCRV
jgi:hypothetical protein